MVECARRRRIASRDRARQQRHRLLARLLRQLHTGRCRSVGRRPGAPPAAAQAQGRGRGRAGVTQHPATGRRKESPSYARSGWRRSSPRSTIAATVYVGYQFVFRSTNRGETWERISPDLSSNDPAQMLLKSSSAIPYQTIVALAESPTQSGRALRRHRRRPAARDDGRWKELDRSDVVAASAQVGVARRAVAHMPRERSTSRCAAAKTTTSRPTSTSRPTTAGRSRASSPTCRPVR